MKRYSMELSDDLEQELSGIAALTGGILHTQSILGIGVVLVKKYVEKTMEGYELYFVKKDNPEEKIYVTLGQIVDDSIKRHK